MNREALRRLLDDVRAQRLTVEEAVQSLRRLPFEDLGFAKLDQHRALRTGAPEAIFCQGKTPEQIVAIAGRLAATHVNVLGTRADTAVATAIAEAGLPHVYHAQARLLIVRPAPVDGVGLIVVAAAGTAGLPVAEGA